MSMPTSPLQIASNVFRFLFKKMILKSSQFVIKVILVRHECVMLMTFDCGLPTHIAIRKRVGYAIRIICRIISMPKSIREVPQFCFCFSFQLL